MSALPVVSYKTPQDPTEYMECNFCRRAKSSVGIATDDRPTTGIDRQTSPLVEYADTTRAR